MSYEFSYTSAKARLLSSSWLGLNDGVMLHIVASLAAGTVATTVCAPSDVLKSRMQNAAAVGRKSAVRRRTHMSGMAILKIHTGLGSGHR